MTILLLLLAVMLWPAPAHASGLVLPPAARHGLDLLYGGRPDQAIAEFRQIEKVQPDDPLGYLLEADARWWQVYCEACEIKWNAMDAWPQPPRVPSDDGYLALTQKVIRLSEARIATNDSATLELYAGMGWLLRARMLALRDERLPTARAGVNARTHLLRCLAQDPDMADAYTGLGLYNYYVDTLSGFARALRFLMGIPGGDKHDGIRQLRIAIQEGSLTPVEASFYLAKNLRIYERDYTGAAALMTPLVSKYPQNPIFHLLLGDFERELGQSELAAESFHTAEGITAPSAACGKRVHDLADQDMAMLSRGSGSAR